MSGGPDPLKHLEDQIGETMRAERVLKKLERGQTRHDREQLEHAQKHLAEVQIFLSFDLNKSVQELDKELPQDLQRLFVAANSPLIPVERRAKLVELLMHKRDFSWGETMRGAFEARDAAVRYAILSEPKIFELLSNRTERWEAAHPKGLYPATAVMQAMVPLRFEGDDRKVLEKELAAWPPDALGRMLFHTDDAAKERKYFEQDRGAYLREVLAGQYGKMSEAEQKAFKEGYTQAQSVQPAKTFPKDVTDLRK